MLPNLEEATEDMFMMLPPPPFIIIGRKAWIMKYMLLTLTFIVKSHSSSLVSKIFPWWTILRS